MAQGGSRLAVVSALIGNFLVMVAKFIAFALTGSGAMLSEGIHSIADLLNQFLLLIGIVRSGRTADLEYQYGYGSERYVWALISAVGIFFLGCGFTMYHGVHSLIHPPATNAGDHLWTAIGVLIFSLVVEGYVLMVAVKAVRQQSGDEPLLKFMREKADPSVVAVVLEDAAACLGIVIAMVAIILAHVTGHVWWDAVGSLTIGVLLGAIAIFLVLRNKELLVGQGVPPHIRAQLLQILRDNPAVEEVVDMRTRILDSDTYRIKADVRFDGAYLARTMRDKLKAAYPGINSYDDFEHFVIEFADDVVELLAEEINEIERQMKHKVPEAQHMDIEAD
ncbi:cation diffusion facilitator family transporter [bacterium]|nr:cation diffusion facilitator family transporter [bacterium]